MTDVRALTYLANWRDIIHGSSIADTLMRYYVRERDDKKKKKKKRRRKRKKKRKRKMKKKRRGKRGERRKKEKWRKKEEKEAMSSYVWKLDMHLLEYEMRGSVFNLKEKSLSLAESDLIPGPRRMR